MKTCEDNKRVWAKIKESKIDPNYMKVYEKEYGLGGAKLGLALVENGSKVLSLGCGGGGVR